MNCFKMFPSRDTTCRAELFLLGIIVALLTSVHPAPAQPYSIDWHTTDGGGGTSTGGDIEIGSRNASVMNVAMWNSAAGSFMNLYALTFNPTSDRNLKQNFKPVDPEAILNKVVALPLMEWAYKADQQTRHLGPVAQDFRAAFNLSSDDKSIATVDAAGVSLAAIQGLNQKPEEQLRTMEAEISELRRAVAELIQLVNSQMAKQGIEA